MAEDSTTPLKKIDKEKLKQLSPEERIKHLKEIEKSRLDQIKEAKKRLRELKDIEDQSKKEIKEAEHLIKESFNEMSHRTKQKEQEEEEEHISSIIPKAESKV